MQTVRQQWTSILGRIDGLADLARSIHGRDDANVFQDFVYPEAAAVLVDIRALSDRTGHLLSEPARQTVVRLLDASQLWNGGGGVPAAARVGAGLTVFLGSFRYHMHDEEASWCAAAERAFLHLNRLLATDGAVQRTWDGALRSGGETAIEGLGATHLLWHGLWAFKVRGKGECTDLVLGTRLTSEQREFVAADALVLTEWKVCKEAGAVGRSVQQAIIQTRSYTAGSLAGVELRTVRYVVTVSPNRADRLADVSEGGIIYRHVHVAIAPESPSKDARRSRAPRTKGDYANSDASDLPPGRHGG